MLARIHIIWGGRGLPRNFNLGLRKMNSRQLKNFLYPVDHFEKKIESVMRRVFNGVHIWTPFLSLGLFLLRRCELKPILFFGMKN